jgi:putative lipoprotein
MTFRLACFVLLALGAASPVLAAKVSLPGQVTYRERIALPDSARLRIQLIDQTLSAAPPRLDVEAPTGVGQVPLSFTLTFEDSLVLPGHDYALVATIAADDGVLFRNVEPYPVDLLAPAQPVLIVTSFVGRMAEAAPADAPEATAQAAILGPTWTATTIAGEAVVARSTTSLQIGAVLRAGGLGGCNSWFAQAELDGAAIRFGGITSTMRLCFGEDARNKQERTFYDALAATATWQVIGDQLTLYAADGRPLVVFTR